MAMSYKIIIDTKPSFFLKKLAKTAPKDFDKIDGFLKRRLANAEEPLKMPNCTKLVGFDDNRYRWRLGNHRIIALVIKGDVRILKVIDIGKRDKDTYG